MIRRFPSSRNRRGQFATPGVQTDRQENCPLVPLKGPIQRFTQRIGFNPYVGCRITTCFERRRTSRRFVIATPGRNVVGAAVFFVSMAGAFGVIGGIFDTFDGGSLDCLVRVGEIFDRIFRSFWFGREAKRTRGLSCTLRTHFAGIGTEFVGLCSEIVHQLGRAFIITTFALAFIVGHMSAPLLEPVAGLQSPVFVVFTGRDCWRHGL